MRALQYHVVDVFTQRALEGNPLAVFPNLCDLDAATMQMVAREQNHDAHVERGRRKVTSSLSHRPTYEATSARCGGPGDDP